ncbi:1-acyl-sn-glycerol-3-phosphate acyltransferase [Alkalinema sp. FACHB-956]|uniref:lysophospholipid acyltransferase family protein n=1 Tax=Alkalinema sp. FACHB-956 TaxID=2692768 RepID=UPI001F554951|nr:1-acyl-sn-glycerol-3-phosphate acyltransferase [Alkalinema sp. FACHB-956]
MPSLHVQPRLEFIPQTFQPWVLRLLHLLLPFALRFRLRRWLPAGINQVEVIYPERLATAYHQFQQGKIRLLIAARHPEVDDPLSYLFVLSRTIPQVAQQRGIPLQQPIHAHFLYDRGMTIWAGNWLGWFFARIGGIPIHRGKSLDLKGLKAAREVLLNGQFPLAVAPEGATNGHSHIVSPLEPGVAQLGFWCVEDLVKADRPEQVWILPIGIQYHYASPPWRKLDDVISQLEQDTGLSQLPFSIPALNSPEQQIYQRLLRLGEHLIAQMEKFYQQFYHLSIALETNQDCKLDKSHQVDDHQHQQAHLITRLQTLLDIALTIAEQHFGLPSEGNIIQRCRRLEEAGWKIIYREDITNLQTLDPFSRGLADWAATEAQLALRHMRLVESFVAVTQPYLQTQLTVEQLAELTLILFDFVARIKGDKIPQRPQLGWRQTQVTIGQPISVSDRWPLYNRDRASAKQAVQDLTADLYHALAQGIPSYTTPQAQEAHPPKPL